MPIASKNMEPNNVKIVVGRREISVETSYQVRFKKKEDGTFICAIPEFNIFYSAANRESVDRKGDAFIDMFFHYYLDADNRYSLKRLALNLYKLGFKPYNNPSAMVNLMRNKPDSKANFRISDIAIPEGFKSATTIERSTKFAALA